MIVTRLPRDPGPAGWNRLLPEPEPATPLNSKITADWLVIGAGFAGLAAAHRLVKQAKGDKIVVLDAVRVGDGPAGRNSGFMIDLPHDLTSADYGGALEADVAQTQDNRPWHRPFSRNGRRIWPVCRSLRDVRQDQRGGNSQG
jgi:2-polyprenyl-6-methoxyphenol hydroxylase-like FAD-dependent oxidoreductase